jgi:hypothetical protein
MGGLSSHTKSPGSLTILSDQGCHGFVLEPVSRPRFEDEPVAPKSNSSSQFRISPEDSKMLEAESRMGDPVEPKVYLCVRVSPSVAPEPDALQRPRPPRSSNRTSGATASGFPESSRSRPCANSFSGFDGTVTPAAAAGLLHGERAISIISPFQLTRSTSLILAHRHEPILSGFYWVFAVFSRASSRLTAMSNDRCGQDARSPRRFGRGPIGNRPKRVFRLI